MHLRRRTFAQLSMLSIAGGLCAFREPLLLAQSSDAASVPFQPFAAQITRLLVALDALGTPFPAAETMELRTLLKGRESLASTERIVHLLSTHVLLQATINPEARVSVVRGPARAELAEGGWRTFLVLINNQAATTAALRVTSPQAQPMGRHSGLAITATHDFTNGAVDTVEARARWLSIATPDAPPLASMLSGLALEYRIVQLYSRDAGLREASLTVDLGVTEPDLGFRSTVAILFHAVPAHALPLHLLDENGAPTTLSLLVRDGLGRVYPVQTKRDAPDLNFQPEIYREDGEFLHLPEGTYSVTARRGPEYVPLTQTFTIPAASAPQAIALQRWVTPARFGYYSGDTHIHAAGCLHYESPTEGVTPEVMARQVAGEALDLASVLNWAPGYLYQKQFFSGHVHAAMKMPETAPAASLLRYDLEVSGFPSSHCGHVILLRLRDQFFPGAASLDDWPSWNIPILRWAKKQGAVTGYAHSAHGLLVDSTALPNLLMPPFNSMGANEFIVDVTHPGLIDFISGCDLWPFAELNIWYHTLNCGYRTTFAGETDFPCLTDLCVGGGRSYVPLAARPTGDAGYSAWLAGLLHGSSYFGDGRSHLFNFRVTAPHSEHALVDLSSPGTVEVSATVCARLEAQPDANTAAIQKRSPYEKPYWHVERARIGSTRRVLVELLQNGVPIAHQEVEGDGSAQLVQFNIAIEHSSWLALRIYPSSHTNPIFVTVAGAPVRASRASAEWCRKAVDVCWEEKRKRIRPNELAAASAAWDHARAVYDTIIGESHAS